MNPAEFDTLWPDMTGSSMAKPPVVALKQQHGNGFAALIGCVPSGARAHAAHRGECVGEHHARKNPSIRSMRCDRTRGIFRVGLARETEHALHVA